MGILSDPTQLSFFFCYSLTNTLVMLNSFCEHLMSAGLSSDLSVSSIQLDYSSSFPHKMIDFTFSCHGCIFGGEATAAGNVGADSHVKRVPKFEM